MANNTKRQVLESAVVGHAAVVGLHKLLQAACCASIVMWAVGVFSLADVRTSAAEMEICRSDHDRYLLA